MAIRNNPVRGQYLLVGTDLIKAGIRTLAAGTMFLRENGNASAIFSLDPASERWITGGAVTKAVAAAQADGVIVGDLNAIEVAAIKPYLAQSWRTKVRTTEDMIVHMAGADTPEVRAYAQAQVAELEAFYAQGAAIAVA